LYFINLSWKEGITELKQDDRLEQIICIVDLVGMLAKNMPLYE